MIQLPAGCKVGYEIRIVVNKLTDDMGNWFLLQGGQAWATEYLDHRGRSRRVNHVQLGNAKASYKMQTGLDNNYLVRFAGTDAATASVFILKFFEDIVSHNMEETMARYELDHKI